MELVTIAKRNNFFRKFGSKFLRSKYLCLMIVPAIVFYIVFCYVPMYGIVIAFQDYNSKLGVFGSKWVGFANFIRVFESKNFWPIFGNTLIISSIKIVLSFLSAVTIAVLLNELRMRRTKKIVQTIVTFPHL